MDDDLKKCPFCGGSAVLLKSSSGLYYVYCRCCWASTKSFPTPEKAEKYWNRRNYKIKLF